MAVTFDLQEDIGIVQLDDGGKNVINHDVLDELESCWEEAKSKAAAVVIAGRPGSFCAGYDIKVMTGDDPQASVRLGQRGGKLALDIFGAKLPVVGVSPGHAFTIGAVWLACCDYRIGELGNFKYSMTEVALGVPLSDWPMEPLKSKLNPQHITKALLHSEIYAPLQALEAGFVDEVVDSGAGLETGLAKAQKLAALPAHAYGLTKQRLRKQALQVMQRELEAP